MGMDAPASVRRPAPQSAGATADPLDVLHALYELELPSRDTVCLALELWHFCGRRPATITLTAAAAAGLIHASDTRAARNWLEYLHEAQLIRIVDRDRRRGRYKLYVDDPLRVASDYRACRAPDAEQIEIEFEPPTVAFDRAESDPAPLSAPSGAETTNTPAPSDATKNMPVQQVRTERRAAPLSVCAESDPASLSARALAPATSAPPRAENIKNFSELQRLESQQVIRAARAAILQTAPPPGAEKSTLARHSHQEHTSPKEALALNNLQPQPYLRPPDSSGALADAIAAQQSATEAFLRAVDDLREELLWEVNHRVPARPASAAADDPRYAKMHPAVAHRIAEALCLKCPPSDTRLWSRLARLKAQALAATNRGQPTRGRYAYFTGCFTNRVLAPLGISPAIWQAERDAADPRPRAPPAD